MAEIINPLENAELMGKMSTPEGAKEAAKKIVESAVEQEKTKKLELDKIIKQIGEISPSDGGFEEIAVLLALPDEHFSVIAPIFLKELEKNYHNINDQLTMVQMMNAVGMHAEDARNEFINITNGIDEQLGDSLSFIKRDFLKRMLGMTYCRENTKMPTYAHLTDSGMDIYALDDITIAPGETKLVPTGLKVAIPSGYELQVRPKSGRCLKTKLRVANTPGTVDAGYRDEIGVIIDNIEPFIKSAQIDENGRLYNVEFGSSYTIGKGEKFAQLVLAEVPKAVFYQVESVGVIENDGRAGGFGSSGLK